MVTGGTFSGSGPLHDNLIGSQQNMQGKITCNPDGVGISFITDKTDFQFIDSCLNRILIKT